MCVQMDGNREYDTRPRDQLGVKEKLRTPLGWNSRGRDDGGGGHLSQALKNRWNLSSSSDERYSTLGNKTDKHSGRKNSVREKGK